MIMMMSPTPVFVEWDDDGEAVEDPSWEFFVAAAHLDGPIECYQKLSA
jgi:hypothetical protein